MKAAASTKNISNNSHSGLHQRLLFQDPGKPETPEIRLFAETLVNGEDRDLACRKELFSYDDMNRLRNSITSPIRAEGKMEIDPLEAENRSVTEDDTKGKGKKKVAKGLRTFWTKEEDERLTQSVSCNDACQWTLHAQNVGNGRTSKQCRERCTFV